MVSIETSFPEHFDLQLLGPREQTLSLSLSVPTQHVVGCRGVKNECTSSRGSCHKVFDNDARMMMHSH